MKDKIFISGIIDDLPSIGHYADLIARVPSGRKWWQFLKKSYVDFPVQIEELRVYKKSDIEKCMVCGKIHSCSVGSSGVNNN